MHVSSSLVTTTRRLPQHASLWHFFAGRPIHARALLVRLGDPICQLGRFRCRLFCGRETNTSACHTPRDTSGRASHGHHVSLAMSLRCSPTQQLAEHAHKRFVCCGGPRAARLVSGSVGMRILCSDCPALPLQRGAEAWTEHAVRVKPPSETMPAEFAT